MHASVACYAFDIVTEALLLLYWHLCCLEWLACQMVRS